MRLIHARGAIPLDHCLVVGIVNRTPDSFYDGGRMGFADALKYALTLVDEGADVLDLGGVKAGPGAPVGEDEEIERLIPLVVATARETDVPLSVETGRPVVARLAIEAGASLVNDVTGFADPELAKACADVGAAVILMHHGGQIRSRPRHPRYQDVVVAVTQTWSDLLDQAAFAGIGDESVMVDPGLDFGKTTGHSLELIRRLDELVSFGPPVLVAPSRKDVVGESLDLDPTERLEGSMALVALAVYRGAAAVRVHDVRAAVRTVRMVEAVAGRRPPAAPLRGLWD